MNTLVIQVDFGFFRLSVTHSPEEVLRAVDFRFPTDSDLVHKSCDIDACADQSSFGGSHVPGEEQLAVLLVVQAVSVIDSVCAGERT